MDEVNERTRLRRLIAGAAEANAEHVMPSVRRERVLAQALAQGLAGEAADDVPSPRVRSIRVPALSAVAAVAILLGAGVTIWRTRSRPVVSEEPATRLRPAVRVSLGEVSVSGQSWGRGEEVPAALPLSSVQGAELSLGRASVRLGPGATVTVDPMLDGIQLAAGSVSVLVEPSPTGRPLPALDPKPAFRVVTARFVVEVMGTTFEVGDDYVAVQHGVVGVKDPAGMLLATVRAGERWSLEPHPAPAVESPSVRPRQPRPLPPAVPEAGPRPASGAVLAEARRALAAGRVDEARRLVARALTLAGSRADRAEAETLHAECALVAGE